ncbi:MAG: hypothetical protein LBH44_13795 [Treponema sp.]|nr:hypothetical protein [Treponema sp.]
MENENELTCGKPQGIEDFILKSLAPPAEAPQVVRDIIPKGYSFKKQEKLPLVFQIQRYMEKNHHPKFSKDGKSYYWSGYFFKEDENQTFIENSINNILIDIINDSGEKYGITVSSEEKSGLCKQDYQKTNCFSRFATQIITHLKNNPQNVFVEDYFDNQNEFLNTPDGLVDIRNTEILQHHPEQLITMQAGHNILGGLPGNCPESIKEFFGLLKYIFRNDTIFESFMSIFSSLLYSGQKDKRIIFFAGPVSILTLLKNLLQELLGNYSAVIHAEGLCKKRNNPDLRPSLCNVIKNRVIMVYPQDGDVLDTNLLRQITSNTEITLRKSTKEEISFTFKGNLVFFCEKIPKFSNYKNIDSLLSSIVVVPMSHNQGICQAYPYQQDYQYNFNYDKGFYSYLLRYLLERSSYCVRHGEPVIHGYFSQTLKNLILLRGGMVEMWALTYFIEPSNYGEGNQEYMVNDLYEYSFKHWMYNNYNLPEKPSISLKRFSMILNQLSESIPDLHRNEWNGHVVYTGLFLNDENYYKRQSKKWYANNWERDVAESRRVTLSDCNEQKIHQNNQKALQRPYLTNKNSLPKPKIIEQNDFPADFDEI